jgi:hypothetical protein
LSFRGAPVSGGTSDETLQIGNSEKSISGTAVRNGNARALNAPMGAATAAAAAARNTVRRSSVVLSCLISLDIILTPFSIRSAQSHHRRGATTPRPGIFPVTISELGSIPASFQLSLR